VNFSPGKSSFHDTKYLFSSTSGMEK
jgi:hypothetical protein